jgi:hypothetical protein
MEKARKFLKTILKNKGLSFLIKRNLKIGLKSGGG